MYKFRNSIINLKVCSVILLISGLILQLFLQNIFAFMQYLDEAIAIISFLYFLLGYITKKSNYLAEELISFYCMILLIVIGVVGNVLAEVQTNLSAIFMDIGNSYKFLMMYLGTITWIKRTDYREQIINNVSAIVRFIVYLACILASINLFYDIGMSSDFRFGIRSFNFIYESAGILNMYCYAFIIILSAALKNRIKKNKTAIFFILLLWCSTLRMRSFAFSVIFIFIYYMVIHKKNFRLNLSHIAISVLVGYLIVDDQLMYYFTNNYSPRALLLKYGVKTMKNYFPIGAGYATFGTHAASKYYSKLYYEYGFNSMWGLTKEGDYLTDTYWPSIFGQLGVIGTIIMLVLMYFTILSIWKRTRNSIYHKLAAMIGLICICLATIATNSFFHTSSVLIFLLFGLIADSKSTLVQRIPSLQSVNT